MIIILFLCSGYEGLTKNLMSELPDGLVTYNHPVQCVHWNDAEKTENSVTVECENGERVVADHVIVTVPLGNFNLIINPLGGSVI